MTAVRGPTAPVRAGVSCPICEGSSEAIDVVDLAKSCEERRGTFLPLTGVPIYYHRCEHCGFTHAPDLAGWTKEEFTRYIYNDDYVKVDPDYVDLRPRANAAQLTRLFGDEKRGLRHLDYGGGSGLLSTLLRNDGWNSVSYDPFVDRGVRVANLGRFDFITAFEVFEHVPDVHELMAHLSSLLREKGLVLFSTLLSDGHIAAGRRLDWWYASPRNGHVSLYSSDSLKKLGAAHGFDLVTFREDIHAFWTRPPSWAALLLNGYGRAA